MESDGRLKVRLAFQRRHRHYCYLNVDFLTVIIVTNVATCSEYDTYLYPVKRDMIRNGGENEPESFGQRVRSSRQRLRMPDGRRWTQGDLAKAVGVERNTVSRWENGGMLPKDPAIIAVLARVLRVSTDWLLGGLGVPHNSNIPNTNAVMELPQQQYGERPSSAEALPPGASDLVLRYLERLMSLGCTQMQVAEAERIMVMLAQHDLSDRPFSQRDSSEVQLDVDAAWDFVVQVLRRHGIRA
jgi:transcriptional regulator with XRE-family HTH domain